jgi:hypothetical protein
MHPGFRGALEMLRVEDSDAGGGWPLDGWTRRRDYWPLPSGAFGLQLSLEGKPLCCFFQSLSRIRSAEPP